MTIQFIKDEEGKKQYVVIPYGEYFRMRLAMLEYDDDDENDWEDIPYESDIYDNVGLPGEVCDIMHNENVSLQAAWRILCGMSQQEVAEKLGISQSAVSQLEALDSRPQKRTREKLAALYGCKQEQISLYLPKGVLTVAEKFFVGHGRLVRVVDAHMLDVVVVIRHANHHFSGLAQVFTCFGKGVEHNQFLVCIPLTLTLSPKGRGNFNTLSPLGRGVG